MFVVSLLLAGALLFAGYLVSPVVANLFFNTISRTYWIFYFLNDQTSLPVLAVMASALPLVLLGIELPFWIARAAGWRLVRQDGLQHPAIRESLSIGHLMIATGVVGACFALLQIGRHFLKENAEDPQGFLAIVLATALASAIVVTCIAWPLAWAFLKPVRWSVAWLISLAISTSLVVLLSFAFQILTQGRLHWMIVVGIATMIFSYVGGVSTGLALLRIDGWQLAPRGNSLAK